MHELSVSYALVDSALQALNTAEGHATPRVLSLTVLAGDLCGVSRDALRFSFPLAAAGTPLEGAALLIEPEAVTVFCRACNATSPLASLQSFRCPLCGLPTADLRSGEHIRLESMEVEDDRGAAP